MSIDNLGVQWAGDKVGMPRTEQVPAIRIEMDHMKQCIMHMLNPEAMRQAIEGRLDAAIASFNFDQKVQDEAHECIKTAVHDYFQYGNGGKLICAAVKAALDEALVKATGKECDDGKD